KKPIPMAFTSSLTSHFLSLPNKNPSLTPFQSQPFFFPTLHPKPLLSSPTSISTVASASSSKNPSSNNNPKQSRQDEVVEVEVEEELPWIQEKALDLVEFTGSVTQAFPGPRVGPTSLPFTPYFSTSPSYQSYSLSIIVFHCFFFHGFQFFFPFSCYRSKYQPTGSEMSVCCSRRDCYTCSEFAKTFAGQSRRSFF
ncbi:hypothetical protein KIW84_060959, partial [Lathyrus oleraceus]